MTKYRCSRCLRTFDEPYEADQHEHEGAFDRSVIREIEESEIGGEQSELSAWGAGAFEPATALGESDDG